MLHMDPLNINIFHQCLEDRLLTLIMNLFFLTQSLLLLICSMNGLEYMATLDYVLFLFFFFIFIIIKVNHAFYVIKIIKSKKYIFLLYLKWVFQQKKNIYILYIYIYIYIYIYMLIVPMYQLKNHKLSVLIG